MTHSKFTGLSILFGKQRLTHVLRPVGSPSVLMTMVHISRSFAVALSISHPDIDPGEVTKVTGLVPTTVSRCGELAKLRRVNRWRGRTHSRFGHTVLT